MSVFSTARRLRSSPEVERTFRREAGLWISLVQLDHNEVPRQLGVSETRGSPKNRRLDRKNNDQSSTAMQWMFNVGPLRPLVANF